MKAGLLGRSLQHSYSPFIHSQFGSYEYSLFEREPEAVEAFLKEGDFDGINVTIPYKKTAAALCDELTDIAKKLGAVNTVVRRGGRLIGHNTDYAGFQAMVRKSGLDLSGKKVLVLGSGGASATAQLVLRELGAAVVVISRSGEHNYENLHLHADAAAIVNCTPVGMYPNNGQSPVAIDRFSMLEGVLDLVYNPGKTKLLLDAEARGLVAENGLYMLVAQARESAEWFLLQSLSEEVVGQVYGRLKGKMENIVLVGMPGCGKTTVARLLSKHLEKQHVDIDDEIYKASGRTPAQILCQEGEEVFRDMEAAALQLAGKRSGIVISTGGGCVTRALNYEALAQNGVIFWLKRDIDALALEDRPLSQGTDLAQMYKTRQPLYASFAHHIVSNDHSPEETASAIIEIIQQGATL